MMDEPTLLWGGLILFFKYYKAKISKYYGAYDLFWLKILNNKQVLAVLYVIFTIFVVLKRLIGDIYKMSCLENEVIMLMELQSEVFYNRMILC